MPSKLTKDGLTLEKVASAPATADIGAGNAAYYIKESDDKPYSKDGDSGVETKMFMDLTVDDADQSTILASISQLRYGRRMVRNPSAGLAEIIAMPRPDARKVSWLNATNTGYTPVGIPAQTDDIAPANGNDTDSSYASHTTTAAANTAGGVRSATFNLFRTGWNPLFAAVIRTGATMTAVRHQFGLASANPSLTSDTINPTHYVGFRHSTLASDTNWKLITSDAAGMTVTDLGVPINASTSYLLLGWVFAGVAYGCIAVNGGALSTPVSASANVPTSTQDLGYVARHITTSASARVIKISRLYFETD